MQVKRLGPFGGIYRLYSPQRRVWSVRIWFSQARAEQAAAGWSWGFFETKPKEIVEP